MISTIDGPYDLVFIDADKENYDLYFEAVLPKMQKGGLIISDNVMWSGKVLSEVNNAIDKKTLALKKFNKKLTIFLFVVLSIHQF